MTINQCITPPHTLSTGYNKKTKMKQMQKETNTIHRPTSTLPTWLKGVILITTLLFTTNLSAQNFSRRGFAFGADRDTLLYIIASPFDNWYLTVGGGAQTFIGNELHASARHNKLNYNLKAEVGKWIIPDLAVSLRLSYFSVDGQSRYSLQPFIDFTGVPTEVDPDDGITYYQYQPYHAHALGIMGYVILDWTNFFRGYELGRRTHTHIYSPIGLGFSALHGKQVNPRGNVGEFRINWELSYSVGIGIEYEATQKLAFSCNMEVVGSESTWDWSPFDNSYSRFDVMPTITFGVRFNLLKQITKYDMASRTSSVQPVKHYFDSFGTRNTVSELSTRIEVLNREIDNKQNQANANEKEIAQLIGERDSLQDRQDSLQNELDNRGGNRADNVMQALQYDIQTLGLPSTIIYFDLDKYNLKNNERNRLRQFARKMERLPDTLEFYIIGAADSATGSIRHNQWLSEKRCQSAYNALVNDYGADPNQLTMRPVGGITVYAPDEDNRMVIVILRTKEVDETLDLWTRHKKR